MDIKLSYNDLVNLDYALNFIHPENYGEDIMDRWEYAMKLKEIVKNSERETALLEFNDKEIDIIERLLKTGQVNIKRAFHDNEVFMRNDRKFACSILATLEYIIKESKKI